MMFERYTESARRSLFFARFEASQMGSTSLEAEHVLLGLLRESKGVVGAIFSRAHLTLDGLATDLDRRSSHREKVPTSVEIPFTAEAKRALLFAAEEADRLQHRYIGTEHLLLGLLREEHSIAASILRDHGLRLDALRTEIAAISGPQANDGMARTPPEDARAAIDEIKAMVLRLSEAAPGTPAARELVAAIVAALDGLADRLR